MKTAVIVLILACVLHHYSGAQMPHKMLRMCCPGVNRNCVHETSVKKVVNSTCGVNAILVIGRDRNVCLDSTWEWAQKLLEKFNNPAAKEMKLDYSKCPRNKKQKNPPAVSQPPQ